MTLTATLIPDINSTVTDLADLAGFGNPVFGDAAVSNETPVNTMPDELTWEDLALCRTTANASELFFSEELHEIAAAKRVCAECPVIAPCLEGAIRRAEPCGVWGGQLFENGKILTIKRKRGRPPKNPRPEDQIPMIPIPEHLEQLIA